MIIIKSLSRKGRIIVKHGNIYKVACNPEFLTVFFTSGICICSSTPFIVTNIIEFSAIIFLIDTDIILYCF